MLNINLNLINNLKIQEQIKDELLFLYERFSTKTISLMNKLLFEIENIKKNINEFGDQEFTDTIYNEFKLKILMNQNIIDNKIESIDKNFKELDLKKLEQLMNEIIYKLNENYIISIKKIKEFILANYEINFDYIQIKENDNKLKFEDFSNNNLLKAIANGDYWSYEILGVSLNASDIEIKQAYKILAKRYHPDNNKDPEAEEMMKLINKAYNILKGKE
ncbi:hypothetical protein EMELA_v1c04290 [Mesoplasma melaleucae]|uniref:J domain-containing protein n=1 Tax=Mesoplasma melaleucae TaxID=81459 RepID=A0A2K8NVX3_9MOLU|nr:DnaJ domain-containing protein [Mesoplasma melaleucae]ATZ17980.1 hypothetical protein EMELA_v1c04290 [Mesoplasma melaleucae]